MSIKQAASFANGNSTAICFGMDRQTDERSLKLFLKQFSRETLLESLLPRLADKEISQVVDLLSGLMRDHLTNKEYHRLFLQD